MKKVIGFSLGFCVVCLALAIYWMKVSFDYQDKLIIANNKIAELEWFIYE